MSELLTLLELVGPATAVAAAAAAVVLLICGLPWWVPRPGRVAAGGALAVGLGFALGCWWLGVTFTWPPREDQDRLLLVLLPAVVLVEVLAAMPWLPRIVAWLLRLAVAAVAARVLLHQSIYLVGPGDTQWSPEQTWLILGGLAGLLAIVWALLSWHAHRLPGRSLPLALALTCAAAGGTIMLSGYHTGGKLGFPLFGALLGATVASVVVRAPRLQGALGVGLVGLFALLVVGRFFGELNTTYLLILFLAPLLCWVPALPGLHRMPGLLRGPVQVVLVVIPLALVGLQALDTFKKESLNKQSDGESDYSMPSPGTGTPGEPVPDPPGPEPGPVELP
jgi:hypothetical protein